MSEYDLNNVENWSASELAAYLKTKGLGDYAELFENQGVSGDVAHRLTDKDLKEMGVDKVGDRLRLLQALESIRKAAANESRERVIWEGEEVLFFSWFDAAWSTCCGCCPVDGSHYTLRNNLLEIKTLNPCRIGPCMCCCGHSYEVDNVDLSGVVDTDVQGKPPPCYLICCCGKTLEYVEIKTKSEGLKILTLDQDEGQEVARKIKLQVEHTQRIERS